MLIGELALLTAAFFTGAASFINFAEQPARLKLDPKALQTQWVESYKRGFKLQAPLALVCGLMGLIAFHISRDWRWTLGAALILTNMPYSILMMMPLNRKLLATSSNSADTEIALAIETWGKLHIVRTLLGACATAVYLWSLH